MKGKEIIAFAIISLICLSSQAFGEFVFPVPSAINYVEYNSVIDTIETIDNSKQVFADKGIEEESPLRRFEITFFISLPFVFIACFATFHVYGVISERDFNVDVWGDYGAPFIISALGVSSGIALREAYICHRSNKERRNILKKPLLHLSYTKRY